MNIGAGCAWPFYKLGGDGVAKFLNGNTYGKMGGRPKGSRSRFNAHVYECVLTFLQHNIGAPAPEQYANTELWGALKIAQRQGQLLREILKMVDRNFTIEHSATVTELDDDVIDRLIETLRARAIEERAAAELSTPQPKMIEHVSNG